MALKVTSPPSRTTLQPETSLPTVERTRLLLTAGLGLAAGAVSGLVAPWQLAVLIGWVVTAVSLTAWTVTTVGRMDPAATEANARREDESRTSIRLVLVVASTISLIGVALALIKANDADGPLSMLLTGAAIATVATSWFLVHTVFTLRYGDLYFSGAAGGIDFPHDDRPDYWDFAYLAFTVGMTFQVSDTDIRSRSIRHAVLRHALLSYLFGAVIVAVTINVIGGLFR